MATMIQIRNVPDDMHRRLKARAALLGMSMSDYLVREIRSVLERPTRDEILQRIASRPAIRVRPEPAVLLRRERERA